MTTQDKSGTQDQILDGTWTRVPATAPEGQGRTFPLPGAEEVERTLSGLLARRVVVEKAEPLRLKSRDPRTVATYATDEGQVCALCICDIDLACFSGAALSMVPQAVALHSIRRHELEEPLDENFREIMNVLASGLNVTGTPHLVFRSVHPPREDLPGDVQSLLGDPAARIDFRVEIDAYGEGRMTLLVASLS